MKRFFIKGFSIENFSIKRSPIKNFSVKSFSVKQLSIKMRVTLWYSLLMLLLTALVLGLLVFVSEFIAENGVKNVLVTVVEANMDEMEYDDGRLDIDNDFAYFKNGVSSAVYSDSCELLDGELPDGFQTDEPLADGAVRTVVSGGHRYNIYDRRVLSGEYEDDLWIRGIIPAGIGGRIGTVMKTAFGLLPFIVLVAALGGYRIAKSSFEPVEKIMDAANAINEGSDLSKRIGLEDGRDEIHRLAATFDRMFSRLEASFEEEKQFTSDVSHELRTPVSAILSQCEYALEDEEGVTEAELRESLETAQRQAMRMSRLISQLLAFTRLEQGQEKADFEETDLSELAAVVCEEQNEIERKGKGKEISLSADIEPGICARVDRCLIARLLSNLICNAYQYGREGGWIRVRLHREEGEGKISLSVSDNGIGIAAEHLDKIWRRFYQADRSRTANENGSVGLGLSMVKQIAKIHGGTVRVESSPGKGSTFTLEGLSP